SSLSSLDRWCCRQVRSWRVIRWYRTRLRSSTRSSQAGTRCGPGSRQLYRDGAEWQRRITALQLVIGKEPARWWTMALLPGQDVASLGEDGYFGYGVDAGTGTLADRVTIEALSEWDYDRIDATFIPAKVPDDPIEAVIAAVVDEMTGANVYV